MRFFIAPLFCFLCAAAYASNENALPRDSLFLTPEEAHRAEMLAAGSQNPGEGNLNLGAIFYDNPENWSFWLRGEKWTPDTLRDDITVIEVTADQVRFLWKAEDGSGDKEITLSPHETYQISSGEIIRGP